MIDNNIIRWVRKTLPSELEKDTMTLAQQWKYEGRQEGVQEGIEIGALGAERNLLMRLLEKRFSTIPTYYLKIVQNADSNKLQELSENILDAGTLQGVFERESITEM